MAEGDAPILCYLSTAALERIVRAWAVQAYVLPDDTAVEFRWGYSMADVEAGAPSLPAIGAAICVAEG